MKLSAANFVESSRPPGQSDGGERRKKRRREDYAIALFRRLLLREWSLCLFLSLPISFQFSQASRMRSRGSIVSLVRPRSRKFTVSHGRRSFTIDSSLIGSHSATRVRQISFGIVPDAVNGHVRFENFSPEFPLSLSHSKCGRWTAGCESTNCS